MSRPHSASELESKLQALYLLAQQGDQVAYQEFLEGSSDAVKKLLSFLNRSRKFDSSLDDLLQEVLLKIHTKKHTYIPGRPILPWIHAITRYTYIDLYRKQKAGPEMTEIPEDLAIAESSETDLTEVWDFLTPEQREIITAVKIEGRPYAEVAKEYKIRESALKVRVHRLLQDIRSRLN